jgi:two-component system, OmpR family, phosphate regulon sensor histidine kinase PhoR
MKRLFGATDGELEERLQSLEIDAERARILIEESRENVVVVDEGLRVVAASRRARETVEGLEVGTALTVELLEGKHGQRPVVVPYELDGRREALVYLGQPGDLGAYEELRAGFTAAVSHELRTPLARLLALLETALLPGTDTGELLEQSRAEVEQMRELIDDVLFLSELETGRAVVSLSATPAMPVLRQVAADLAESAARAGVEIRVDGDPNIELALRPRMLRVVAQNLAANAIRYAGPHSTFTLSITREDGRVVLRAVDDGIGVREWHLPRLFERFYRADRVRTSRGTGLGLAIVKHIVTAAGGTVEAVGGPGRGLEIRCVFRAA